MWGRPVVVPLVSSCCVLACQLWCHEKFLSPWTQADWIACQLKVPRSFAADACLMGTFTARVVLFLILYGINWYRVIPLDPPTEILICPHWSPSNDPSTLLLEVGRQVVLGHHLTLNYWLSRHFLCGVWMYRAMWLLLIHILLAPSLFYPSWVKGCKSGLESLPHSLICQLIIRTPLDPHTQPLRCQWLHCSSSSDPSTLLLEVGREVVQGQYLVLTCRWSRLSLVVCGCAVSSTQLFLWVKWLWKYTFVRSALS